MQEEVPAYIFIKLLISQQKLLQSQENCDRIKIGENNGKDKSI